VENALAREAAEVGGSPLGKREQTKAQNRQLILEAARRVFAELGFGATTVRDIVRATPLASGTFYNYFTSKEELLVAVVHELEREMVADWQSAVAGIDDPLERIVAALDHTAVRCTVSVAYLA